MWKLLLCFIRPNKSNNNTTNSLLLYLYYIILYFITYIEIVPTAECVIGSGQTDRRWDRKYANRAKPFTTRYISRNSVSRIIYGWVYDFIYYYYQSSYSAPLNTHEFRNYAYANVYLLIRIFSRAKEVFLEEQVRRFEYTSCISLL